MGGSNLITWASKIREPFPAGQRDRTEGKKRRRRRKKGCMRGSQPAIAGFEHGWWVPLTKEGGQPPEARNSVWPTAIKKSGISDI